MWMNSLAAGGAGGTGGAGSGASGFGVADWAVLVGYLALLVFTGWWFGKREQKNTRDYFLASRRMPMWAVAVSIIATSLSAATFVGAPEQAYTGDLTYLSTNLGGLIAVLVVAFFFIPAFYKHDCTTVYELLEKRFGTPAKHAASAAFMIGRLFASGARVYIGAIPLCMILFGAGVESSASYPMMMIAAILVLTLVGTLYTLFGGIASVIWTDVIQTCVLVVAVLAAIVVLYNTIDLPVSQIMSTLKQAGKLTVVNPGVNVRSPGLGFDPGASFTLLTALFGFSLLNIAALGTDHDLVQRMLTCKNAVQGGRSVLLSMAIGLPIVTAFMVVGLLLYVSSHWLPTLRSEPGRDPVGFLPIDSKNIFINFILTDMPTGLRALMLAGLFAAGVGSLTSAINALAATTITDFYKKMVPSRGERHYLLASRAAVLGWGAGLALFAVLCLFWQRSSPGTTLISLALSVMTFAYAGLLAVFLTALFTRRGSVRSVIAALITGFVVITLLQPWAWKLWTPLLPVVGQRLSAITLAFPWHMTIGTALAMGVCVLGKSKRPAGWAKASGKECESCGYSLAGLPGETGVPGGQGGRCPECGEKGDV